MYMCFQHEDTRRTVITFTLLHLPFVQLSFEGFRQTCFVHTGWDGVGRLLCQ